ncbi:hypothetical protein SVA_3760 [Sulfurifustis variabilis]|uniref:Uncharacterized protein n=1 Tax=Sulfurifustis variabilis TaxID=1675686 RepID=A0A1B4VBZ2_9GAMM|nr:hypothetical protein [Sulfurifustis variabilis]BAU50294.1 hypothetical protein SVA_3760 [Sulfurifustis variabilis]
MNAVRPLADPGIPPQLLLGGRTLDLRLTRRAERALRDQREALEIEMELYFSCFLRKRVYFLSAPRDAVARGALTPNVNVSFRAVTTRACVVGDVEGRPDLERLPLKRAAAFMPRWISLDYRGRWSGEFGY